MSCCHLRSQQQLEPPTSPSLPLFNWTWSIFEFTSFSLFPTKKANPLWVTSFAAHCPGSETVGRAHVLPLSRHGAVRGVSTADTVWRYNLQLPSQFSAVVLIHTRALLSELHANTPLANIRRLWLLSQAVTMKA